MNLWASVDPYVWAGHLAAGPLPAAVALEAVGIAVEPAATTLAVAAIGDRLLARGRHAGTASAVSARYTLAPRMDVCQLPLTIAASLAIG